MTEQLIMNGAVRVKLCFLSDSTARSPILAKMVETNRLTQQGMEGTIFLDDIGAKAFEFLLKFVYTGSLESVVGLDCDAVTEVLDACRKVKLVYN
jgi:hypothetical protein